tara:strand:- start:27695 stop:27973 length:279 start_codon:yes stop_codon:yes gene_type:complete
MTKYQIKGDLLSRKDKVVVGGIKDMAKAKDAVELLERKGWTNITIEPFVETKEKPDASATKKPVPKQGRKRASKGLASDNKSQPKDDSKKPS